MEELQNSEFLEKEILDDARKKAERILRASEKDKEKLEREWESRFKATVAELEARYEGLQRQALNRIEDSLPLEKKRRRLAFFESRFSAYLDAFFAELDQEALAGIIARGLEARKAALEGRKVAVGFSGLDELTARGAVKRGLGGAAEPSFARAEGQARGLVVSGDGGEVICRLTVDELKSSLRRGKRAALGRLIGVGEEPQA